VNTKRGIQSFQLAICNLQPATCNFQLDGPADQKHVIPNELMMDTQAKAVSSRRGWKILVRLAVVLLLAVAIGGVLNRLALSLNRDARPWAANAVSTSITGPSFDSAPGT